MKTRFELLLAMKHMIIEYVCFQHPCCLLPEQLKPLKVNFCFSPPVVYLYLLQFLSWHHLGNYREKQIALHNLKLTIIKENFIMSNISNLRRVHASLDIVNALL